MLTIAINFDAAASSNTSYLAGLQRMVGRGFGSEDGGAGSHASLEPARLRAALYPEPPPRLCCSLQRYRYTLVRPINNGSAEDPVVSVSSRSANSDGTARRPAQLPWVAYVTP